MNYISRYRQVLLTAILACPPFTVSAQNCAGQSTVIGSLLAFGDSITAGYQNANRSWADELRVRLDGRITVVKNGGTGRQVLTSLDDFKKVVDAQTNLHYVIVLEGINDLYIGKRSAAEIEAGYREFIQYVHGRGVRSFGGTLIPTTASDPEGTGAEFFIVNGYIADHAPTLLERETERQKLNPWRLIDEFEEGLHFDGVIDFDAAVRFRRRARLR